MLIIVLIKFKPLKKWIYHFFNSVFEGGLFLFKYLDNLKVSFGFFFFGDIMVKGKSDIIVFVCK